MRRFGQALRYGLESLLGEAEKSSVGLPSLVLCTTEEVQGAVSGVNYKMKRLLQVYLQLRRTPR